MKRSGPNHGFKKGASSDNPDRFGKAGQRDKTTIKRLKMYRTKQYIRSKEGRIIGGTLASRDRVADGELTAETGRVAPDRRWFGNTRVVTHAALDKFRDEMKKQTNDPYSVVLRTKALPMGLLAEPKGKTIASRVVAQDSFHHTFGPKSTRKRPRMAAGSLAEVAAAAAAEAERHEKTQSAAAGLVMADENKDTSVLAAEKFVSADPIFEKGQSKRIWGELFKVLDCSDVVIQVLDARDPEGTRAKKVEAHLKANARHKHIIFVLNKTDLVPVRVARRWVATLSAVAPTVAFHASVKKPFGKGDLIMLLRQFAKLHPDKKQISVGLIGYPNVGKSSVINALTGKKAVKAAPVPGETKVWQYVTLMKRIFLIDCPGIVTPNANDGEDDIVLRGVVRAERLEQPETMVDAIVRRCDADVLQATYGVEVPDGDAQAFIRAIASKFGKLKKGGEPDAPTVARMLINDWQRGKIPWYHEPPKGQKPVKAQRVDPELARKEAEEADQRPAEGAAEAEKAPAAGAGTDDADASAAATEFGDFMLD